MNLTNILRKSTSELKKAGIPTASLDVRVLLEDVLKKDSSYFFTHSEMPLKNSQYVKFRSLIRRRKKGEPVAYLVGHKEFYGYHFLVNKNVLIPRPESELLIENAVHFLESRIKNKELCGRKDINVIDIGTGSGNIIISLAKILQKTIIRNSPFIIHFYASDISNKALYIARKNAKLHNVNKDIRFYHFDLFSNKKMPKKFDIIIANLPYVPKAESQNLEAKSLKFEPEKAIFANDNGTQIIKQFLDQAKERISENGLILIEIDPRNAKELKTYASNIFTKSKVVLNKDLSKLNRTIKILYK